MNLFETTASEVVESLRSTESCRCYDDLIVVWRGPAWDEISIEDGELRLRRFASFGFLDTRTTTETNSSEETLSRLQDIGYIPDTTINQL